VLSTIYELTLKVYLKAKEMTNTSRILRLQKQTIFSTFQIPPWENAKGVCLKKFSKALPQKAFITKGI